MNTPTGFFEDDRLRPEDDVLDPAIYGPEAVIRTPPAVPGGIHRCLDCGATRDVKVQELKELDHAPHCSECGGPMERAKQLTAPTQRQPIVRCGHCGLHFVHPRSMLDHLRASIACYHWAAAEDRLIEIQGLLVFWRTVHIERENIMQQGERSYRYQIAALDVNLIPRKFFKYKTRAGAIRKIVKLLPIEAEQLIRILREESP